MWARESGLLFVGVHREELDVGRHITVHLVEDTEELVRVSAVEVAIRLVDEVIRAVEGERSDLERWRILLILA